MPLTSASAAPAFSPTINPDHPSLFAPGDLPRRSQEPGAATGQSTPEAIGEILRGALECLARKSRWTIPWWDEATALGNLLVQAMADGGGANIEATWRVVRASCSSERFEPCSDRGRSDEAAVAFRERLVTGAR